MTQLNLFEPERPIPARRPSNPAFVRKHLVRVMNMVRAAEHLPWSEDETADWAARFPRLAATLPPDEGKAMREAFAAELERLRRAAQGPS